MASWGPQRPFTQLPDDPREEIRREVFDQSRPRSGRPIVGFVYEAILRDQPDGTHAYVGKVMGATEAAVTERFHGDSASAHTSPESIRAYPWKARILPGRQGYRILERIRDTGDPTENDRAVRRAEVFWIDKLQTQFNVVRPVRPPVTRRAPRPAARPASKPRGRQVRGDGGRHLAVAAVLSLIAVYATVIATVLHMGGASGPIAWVTPPAGAVFLTWRTLLAAERPRRRRRRR